MLRRSLFPLGLSPLWQAFAQSSAPGTARDEAYWAFIRKQFPLRDGLIYCNAANVCPASLPVLDRHQHYLRDFERDPSFQNRAKFGPMREKVRARAAQFFGVTSDELAFTRNTSEANNTIVHGLNLKAGDEVVLVEDNHPSNLDSWKNHSRRAGFSLNIITATQLIDSVDALAGKVESALTPKTKFLSLTHVTSSTGLVYPVARLSRAAREKGIWTHVDGAQSGGMLSVDLPEDGKGGARFLEAYGQRDDARLAGLDATFEFLMMVGMPAVEARIRQLTTHLMDRLASSPKVSLRTNRKEGLYCGVVKVDLPGVASLTDLDKRLYEQQGMAFSVTGQGPIRGIRVSPHIYNSIEQMDAVADALVKA